MGDDVDLLKGARWWCAGFPSGAHLQPGAWGGDARWMAATVPGTVAQALVTADRERDLDGIDDRDWWYRAEFSSNSRIADLDLKGLATHAEVWINGERVARSTSMFLAETRALDNLGKDNEIAIRFGALAAERVPRRPRARWRVARLRDPALRWHRTSMWGRLTGVPAGPPPVGPWRPVRLRAGGGACVVESRLQTSLDGTAGIVDAVIVLSSSQYPGAARVIVAGAAADASVVAVSEGRWMLRARLLVDDVERWWPHSLGRQALYDVSVDVGGAILAAGRVGFRDISIDTSDGGFRFVVNGTPVFIGGACWTPLDAITLQNDRERLRVTLQSVLDANLAMLRVSGDTVYEDDVFYELCDEMGILIWQDCMLAFYDPPVDDAWEEVFLQEARQNLARITSHPCVAIVSGGSEIAQQAVYAGADLARGLPLLTEKLRDLVDEVAPQLPYVPTSPWGGAIPTRPDTGVSHYYGVGAYLRGVEDAVASRQRFSAECLAFSNPPARQTVDEVFGSTSAAGHDPVWKAAIYRDAGASWDFEDVRDHYVRELFGVDPFEVRRVDPDRALDLGRAAVALLMQRTFAQWRRQDSPSGGGLVFQLHDAVAGAGMGVIDALGRPKTAWYALRRVLAPIAVSVTDEGLNGLIAHVHNDSGEPLEAVVRVELFVDGELQVDAAEQELSVPARSSVDVGVDELFAGFRDVAWTHRFGPLTYDVIAVILSAGQVVVSEAVHLPAGDARPVERALGLTSEVTVIDRDTIDLALTTRRFAQCVTVEAPGWHVDDSGFDLAPGREKHVHAYRLEGAGTFIGEARPLNGNPVVIRQRE